ncbi:MAG: hypothetical protein JO033_18445 [Acidobacteriaceae bacterium]|nr:hypothetical protein [Acidobacteriaceae bacterium]MBV9502554.1 hypothetical protein [Acidobacteriaceae bacterium]
MNGLFGSAILEVAIGIIFIYLLLAICCTTVNEWISGLLKMRSKLLVEGIRQLLGEGADPASGKITTAFWGHPLIRGLMRRGEHPSYLSARTFAAAVLDLATPNRAGEITFDDLEAGIKNDLPDSSFRTSLLALLQNTGRTVHGAEQNIEAWYNDSMDRVSGWYKRKTQVWTLVVASILTLATNADTINITRRVWIEPTLRNAFLALAQNPNALNGMSGGRVISANAAHFLGQVIGWPDLSQLGDVWSWPERVLGWILTIIAVSLGAPFWFDALKRFMNLRSAGRSPIEFGPPPDKPSTPLVVP